mmetsp:Transcript_43579/g.134657  ORF Transcript_43579/g.134657 Transcript_43579/m.134657 type:complete len:260 (-) Transcript_43579:51-830(-)
MVCAGPRPVRRRTGPGACGRRRLAWGRRRTCRGAGAASRPLRPVRPTQTAPQHRRDGLPRPWQRQWGQPRGGGAGIGCRCHAELGARRRTNVGRGPDRARGRPVLPGRRRPSRRQRRRLHRYPDRAGGVRVRSGPRAAGLLLLLPPRRRRVLLPQAAGQQRGRRHLPPAAPDFWGSRLRPQPCWGHSSRPRLRRQHHHHRGCRLRHVQGRAHRWPGHGRRLGHSIAASRRPRARHHHDWQVRRRLLLRLPRVEQGACGQ